LGDLLFTPLPVCEFWIFAAPRDVRFPAFHPTEPVILASGNGRIGAIPLKK
jgi:hypothetical protein